MTADASTGSVPGLPRPPRGMLVEMVAVPGKGDEPPRRALAVSSRAHGRRVTLGALLGSSVLGLVAAPGLLMAGAVAFPGLMLGTLGRKSVPLLIHDDHVVASGVRRSLTGVTKVSVTITEVWLHHGTSQVTVFTGRHVHLRWVARLLREVLRLGHIPIELSLPPARASVR